MQHREKVLLQEQNPSGRGGVEWVPPPYRSGSSGSGVEWVPPPINGVEWVSPQGAGPGHLYIIVSFVLISLCFVFKAKHV